MQRNWDIIRKILLKVEQLPTEDSTKQPISIIDEMTKGKVYERIK